MTPVDPALRVPGSQGPGVRALLASTPAALAIGVIAALVLALVETAGSAVEWLLWQALPGLVRVDPDSGWWILAVLGVTGAAVGVVLRWVPGHGGRDSATTELIAPPLPAPVLPSLALVAVLGLAGGVSLGPESPVIALTTGLLVWTARLAHARTTDERIVELAAAATIGALFGTPVAAALVFTGLPRGRGDAPEALWDRLFLPLVAAGTGALTMTVLAHPQFAIDLPAYGLPTLPDVGSAAVVATCGAALGVGTAAAFPWLHRQVRRLPGPVLGVTIAGLVLGVLGAIGGPLTLFNGAAEVGPLVAGRDDLTVPTLVLVLLVKCAALLVAGASGFRGGRVFPAVFIGATLGLLAHAVVPSVPVTVAVAGGVLGVVLAVSRDGWIALFVATALTGSVTVLALLCVAILPAWLVVTRAPEMIVHDDGPHPPDARW